MQFAVCDTADVMQRATRLAIETGHYLFDTLYHAVALEHASAVLVTADQHFRRKAERYGAILPLERVETIL